MQAGPSIDQVPPAEALKACGVFTFFFAVGFKERLVPQLGEGVILMWTTVLIWVVLELGAWHTPDTYLTVGAAVAALVMLVSVPVHSPAMKILVYTWFLLTVVALGALQFRSADFMLIASGRSSELPYLYAWIDGMAGAYIGVHVVLLVELLPLKGRGEDRDDFKKRWHAYLDLAASRFDDQRLQTRAAIGLVCGIALLAATNHVLGLMPGRPCQPGVVRIAPGVELRRCAGAAACHALRCPRGTGCDARSVVFARTSTALARAPQLGRRTPAARLSQ